MKTKMKKILVIIVLLITTNAFAQQENRQPPAIEKRVENVIKKIEKKIEINESQKASIEEAFTVFFTKADEQIESGQRPERSVIEGLEKERDNSIKQVLLEEQYEDYLKISCKLGPQPQQQRQNQGPPK